MISHPEIRLNMRDRQGMTPFACAMTYKNNKAAEAILKREAGAAEQVRWGHDIHTGFFNCTRCTGVLVAYALQRSCFILLLTSLFQILIQCGMQARSARKPKAACVEVVC